MVFTLHTSCLHQAAQQQQVMVRESITAYSMELMLVLHEH